MSTTTTQAVEHVDDAIDGIVEVVEIVRNNPVVLTAASVAGVAVGAAVGYFVARKLLTSKYEVQIAEEIEEARNFFYNLNKVNENGENLSPQDVLLSRQGEEAVAAVHEYQGRVGESDIDEPVFEGEPHDDVRDEEQIEKLQKKAKKDRAVNVFSDDVFDLDEEMKYRTEDKPYIITHDEYFAGEKNYDTQSLVYYSVDDTLCDEHDKPLENTDALVGDDHLARFGSGSKDKNIVYVRNDRLETEYEIIRSKGSYLEEVLGMEAKKDRELRHSADERRAFRRGEG